MGDERRPLDLLLRYVQLEITIDHRTGDRVGRWLERHERYLNREISYDALQIANRRDFARPAGPTIVALPPPDLDAPTSLPRATLLTRKR